MADPLPVAADAEARHPVQAAGAVLWRPADDNEVEVALVHRPRYDDWSLPKGKLDPGEHPLLAALREVAEETGVTAVPGRPLGTTRYLVLQRDRPVPKEVRWWAARADGGVFVPGAEVDELRWVAPADALAVLDTDGFAPLQEFLRGPVRTRTLALVRHGHAVDKQSWVRDDDARPLDEQGRREAERLAPVLAAYRPQRIVAAPPLRCTETVRPLADRAGLDVEIAPSLGEQCHAADPDAALRCVLEAVSTDEVAVLCSQGAVLPDLLDALLPGDSGVSTGGKPGKGTAWVLSLADGEQGPRVVGAEHWSAADRAVGG